MEIPVYLPFKSTYSCPSCAEKIATWVMDTNNAFRCPSCDVLLTSNKSTAQKKGIILGGILLLTCLIIEIVFDLSGNNIMGWASLGGIASIYIGYFFYRYKVKIHLASKKQEP